MSAPETAAGPALRLQNVSLQLGATRILQDIDWQVHAGEVHALVGPNGCGKSSLIKTVLDYEIGRASCRERV